MRGFLGIYIYTNINCQRAQSWKIPDSKPASLLVGIYGFFSSTRILCWLIQAQTSSVLHKWLKFNNAWRGGKDHHLQTDRFKSPGRPLIQWSWTEKTIVILWIYNQQFKGTIIFMVFDLQGRGYGVAMFEVYTIHNPNPQKSSSNKIRSLLDLYHLENRWHNSHVLVDHGPLLIYLLGVASHQYVPQVLGWLGSIWATKKKTPTFHETG